MLLDSDNSDEIPSVHSPGAAEAPLKLDDPGELDWPHSVLDNRQDVVVWLHPEVDRFQFVRFFSFLSFSSFGESLLASSTDLTNPVP